MSFSNEVTQIEGTQIEGIQMIGIQRSGSNLLRVIMDQSDAIAAPHPPHLIQHFKPLLAQYGPMDAAGYRLLLQDLIAYVDANPVPWEGVHLNIGELLTNSKNYHLFEAVRLIYEQAAKAKNARYWCCKSMTNVYFAEDMEGFGIHPKYIYLYRDGRDVAASFKKAIVGDKHIYHLATQWKDDQQRCLDLKTLIPEDRFFSLNYERLIAEPEQTVRELCAFLDIPFKESMLRFYESGESKSTAAAGEMWSNVTNPIMSDNSRKFLKSFSPEELELFELIAGDQLQALGYPLYTDRKKDDRLSTAAIEQYEQINRQLKKEILAVIPASDLEKRQPQAEMLTAIRARTSRIPPVDPLITLAKNAGEAIMKIYNDPARFDQVSTKADASPLTLADQASHSILLEGLTAYTPGIPVLSEEGADIPYADRKNWEYFWCVDPLDGTKEFIKRNGEFCINIALIHKDQPVFGLIYVPVTGALYYGSAATGAWKLTSGQHAGQQEGQQPGRHAGQQQGQEPIRLQADIGASEWTAVGSRSHGSGTEDAVLARYPVTRQMTAGSALKFCLIAEGKAHIYYREGPTMEWDTAAGHAILLASDATLTQPGGAPFVYNKESLVNGSFICIVNAPKYAHA